MSTKKVVIQKVVAFVKIVFSVAFLAFSVYLIYHAAFIFGSRVLEDGMLGGDTPYHAALMYALDKFYPSIPIWFPFAGAGSSLILGYWSFSYYMAIAGSHLSSLSIEQMVRVLEFSATPLTAFGIYVYIWIRQKNQFQALLGSLFYFLSSMSWGWIAHAGFFAMHMSVVLYIPAFLFFDLYLEESLKNSSVQKKRLYLFFALLFVAFGMLVHGSFIPNLYLGLPLYALIRSQYSPRLKEKRVYSLLRAIKATFVFTVLGIIVSAFILIPQQAYFNLQPFTPVYGAADTPDLPWRGFLGFERLSGRIGSLYTPLFMSLFVSVWAGIGLVISLVKRNKIAAMGITGFFYVWWLSAAKYLAINFTFLQFFLLPTATRAASITAVFLTILAAYGLWEVANLPRSIILFLTQKVTSKERFVSSLSALLYPFSIVISILILIVLLPRFKQMHTLPVDQGEWGIVKAYSGFGALDFEIPYCHFTMWKDEVGELKTCSDYYPRYVVDHARADFWTQDFADGFNKLEMDKNTRVSISPYMGWMTFSFTRHSEASMVSAPSGQSIINLEWLGIHDVALFLDGDITAAETEEVAKYNGTRYAFFDPGTSERIWYRYPEDKWATVMENADGQVQALEYKDARGIATVSSKPTILVIASDEYRGYDPVLQMALKGMVSFDDGILVDAQTEYIDDFTVSQLREFDVVFLRGYSYKNKNKAWSMLDEYVSDGGNLFVDTGWQFVDEDWGTGPDQDGAYGTVKLPNVFPVNETTWSVVGPTWDGFTLSANSEIGISDLGDPRWGEIGWGASVADIGSLRDWAEPVIASSSEVLMARGEYGKGRVVWSGMNLVSHAFDKNVNGEYEFLNETLDYLLGESEIHYAQTNLSWTNPDEMTISFTDAKPDSVLYYAQSHAPQWRAYVVDESGTKTKVSTFRAGMGYMAVMIPEGVTNGQVVLVLDYRSLFVFSFLVTITVFLILIVLMLDTKYNNSSLQSGLKVKRETITQASTARRRSVFDDKEDHHY